jgi:transketolase
LRSIRTPIVTAEDHSAEGGLGEAVLSALSEVEDRPQVRILAVREMPRSGKPAELLAAAGIDSDHIAAAARELAATRAAV